MISKFFFCTGCCCFCFFFGACCCCLFFIECAVFFFFSLVPLLSQHTRLLPLPELLPFLQLKCRTSGFLVVQLLALLLRLPRWRTTVPRRQWFLGPVDQQSAAAGWWQVAIPKLVHDLVDTRTHSRKYTTLELHCCDVVEYVASLLDLCFLAKFQTKTLSERRFLLPFHFSVTATAASAAAGTDLHFTDELLCVCGCSPSSLCVGVSVLTHWELL